MAPPRRKLRLLDALDASFASHSPASSAPGSAFASPAKPLVKQESTASVLPVKREPVDSDDENYPLKRVKQESRDHALPLAGPSYARQSAEDVVELRRKIEEAQQLISSLQKMMDTVRRKPHKTKADYTRMDGYQMRIADARQTKDRFSALIPAARPANPLPALFADVKPAVKTDMKPLVSSNASNHIPPRAADGSGLRDAALENHLYGAHRNAQAVARKISVASSSRAMLTPPPSSDLETNPWSDDMDLPVPQPGHTDDEHFDEVGNWHGRGRDRFVGPIARADDIEKFLVEAGNAEHFDGNASVDKALAKLKLPALYHPLPGMEIALMPHQVIGVAWMLEKEKGADKGGCLCDEMGLGKTVQMMSVMISNHSDDPMCKTNLIVAPLALLDQWQLELEMKTNCDLKILIYHGTNKPKKKKDLLKYDVILTTFGTLAMEWPDDEEEERREKKKAKRRKKGDDFIESDSEDERKAKRRKKKEPGLLMQIEWYRVIIDEAQNIRNKKTRISRAVTKLETKYRWCLTGTPIINGLADAYGLIRFLRIRPWYDWEEFHSHITRVQMKMPTLATRRLQAIFATILLRRRKDTMLDGQKLIELPEKNVALHKLKFTQEELDIYLMVELRSQAIFNRFLRAGTVLKNYTQVLVLLLRLRQCCSHPSLIQEGEGENGFISAAEFMDKNYNRRYELVRASQLVSPEFVENMKEKFKKVVLERMEAEKQSADATIEGEECPICFDSFTEPVVTPCAHVFCKRCIEEVADGPPVEDASAEDKVRYKQDERPCPVCRGPVSKHKLFSRRAFEPTDAELDPNHVPGDDDIEMDEEQEVIELTSLDDIRPAPGRTLRKRKAVLRAYSDDEDEEDDGPDDDMSDFIVESDQDEEEKDARRALKQRVNRKRPIVLSDDEDAEVIHGAKPDVYFPPEKVKMMPRFLPSTKMKHMMESLKEWAEHHPDEKTLIISQWTQCLQLVSDYLTENGILHVKYQGDMNRQKRDQAVRVFMSKDKATVMLMSLKCGGVGLNLTRANRVISLDLGWSEAVENQAFDRVHRLGQTRSVYVNRLVIANTVEDRVLGMQERKKNLADGSLGEGTGKKIGRLSVRELANLFGLDHRGNVLGQV